MRVASVLVAVLLAGLAATAASAQQVEIKTAPPAREREAEVIAPGLHYETTRPSDADFYPRGPRVRHDPAFIAPFAARRQSATGSGRIGFAGWTAPNTPVGAQVTGQREVAGWFALGFSVTWDGPPAPARAPTR